MGLRGAEGGGEGTLTQCSGLSAFIAGQLGVLLYADGINFLYKLPANKNNNKHS